MRSENHWLLKMWTEAGELSQIWDIELKEEVIIITGETADPAMETRTSGCERQGTGTH